MLTKGAVEDIIVEHLSRKAGTGPAAAPRRVPGLRKKVFLSDWEVRRLYKAGSRSLRVPADAIVSPLSMDWLDFNGVEIIRE
ncbi:MAG: hypothetical protein M0011_13535 [Elusimicrobia bacterium]|nr:hypothetical protein [Elusimicrobiota bacterium]